MAKVSIVFEDTEDRQGNVVFSVDFDPPMEDDEQGTPAQTEAMFCVEIMQRHAQGETLAEIAEDLDEQMTPGTMITEEWDGGEPDFEVEEDTKPRKNN